MLLLKWISDTDLKNEVSQLLTIAKDAKKAAVEEFGKNVIDPFAALFEMSGFVIDCDTWLKSETTRQAQKPCKTILVIFTKRYLVILKGGRIKVLAI